MTEQHPPLPAAGWYPDPDGGPGQRYWDGSAWAAAASSYEQPTYQQPTYGQPTYGQPTYGQPSYGQPAGQGQVPYPYAQQQTGNTFSIIAIVCGAVALLFCPILLGPAGLILGGIGLSKKERLAPIAMVVAGVGMILGFVIGALLYTI